MRIFNKYVHTTLLKTLEIYCRIVHQLDFPLLLLMDSKQSEARIALSTIWRPCKEAYCSSPKLEEQALSPHTKSLAMILYTPLHKLIDLKLVTS